MLEAKPINITLKNIDDVNISERNNIENAMASIFPRSIKSNETGEKIIAGNRR